MRDVLLVEIEQELLDRGGGSAPDRIVDDDRVRLLERVRDDLRQRELSGELLWFVADRGSRRARDLAFERRVVPV